VWWILVLLILAAVGLGVWCVWTATRLDRLHLQLASAQAGMAEALVRRSAAATEVGLSNSLDPASSLALVEAAAAAREGPRDDWQAQSELSAVIRMVRGGGAAWEADDPLDRARREVSMARRIHNDIAVRAQDLHGRRRVRWLHLAGHAARPQTVEFDSMDGDESR
jgi:hypothetical protein